MTPAKIRQTAEIPRATHLVRGSALVASCLNKNVLFCGWQSPIVLPDRTLLVSFLSGDGPVSPPTGVAAAATGRFTTSEGENRMTRFRPLNFEFRACFGFRILGP